MIGITPKVREDDEDLYSRIIDYIWRKFDFNNDGHIKKEEAFIFIDGYLGVFCPSNYNAVYNQIDTDGNGELSKDEMRIFLRLTCKGIIETKDLNDHHGICIDQTFLLDLINKEI